MPMFNLDNYETVEDRLIRFWSDHPNGRINTSIHHYDDNKVVFRAEIYFDANDASPKATGYAEEIRGASPVNKTSHVENGETSAIGRGLANCNYAAKGSRPSREEMEKVVRPERSPSVERVEQGAGSYTRTFAPSGTAKKGPIQIKDPGAPASPAQINKIRMELRKLEIPETDHTQFIGDILERTVGGTDDLSKGEASRVIQQLVDG